MLCSQRMIAANDQYNRVRILHRALRAGSRNLEHRDHRHVRTPPVLRSVTHLSLQRLDHSAREVHLLELLGAAQATGAEDIHLHQLVSHDIQPNEKHSVHHELGTNDLRNSHYPVVHLEGRNAATSMHVAAHVTLRTNPPHACILALRHQRQAIHHEHARVTIHGFGKVLLCHHVAIAAYRLYHLVEVRAVVRPHEEDILATGALQRLEHDRASLLTRELLDVVAITRDECPGAHLLRKILEVHLVHRP